MEEKLAKIRFFGRLGHRQQRNYHSTLQYLVNMVKHAGKWSPVSTSSRYKVT